MKPSAKRITTDLMTYLRFEKRAYLLASEVKYNRCRSDVLALVGGAITEYEVKISKTDFLKDFEKTLGAGFKRGRTRVSKHALYQGSAQPKNGMQMFCPHFFIFVVPEELVPLVQETCKEYPAYGIMSWSLENKFLVKPVKAAKALNKEPVNKRVLNKILQRATSELVTLRQKALSTSKTDP
jgi:hypothetical protein